MYKYVLKRLLMLIPVIIGVTFIVFFILNLSPGDPAAIILGDQASAEALAMKRKELGLDDPLLVRYGHYMINMLHGDLGTSYKNNLSVWSQVMERFPNTAVLAVAGILLYFLLQDVEETAILPALSGIVAAMAVLLPWVRRSSVLREFGNSPTLTQPFTLRLEEQALQVWSKFEQYTLPWQGITYAKETKDYIILIGCYRMGLFVIEKADCDPADLNALLSALHEKAPAFGGAK